MRASLMALMGPLEMKRRDNREPCTGFCSRAAVFFNLSASAAFVRGHPLHTNKWVVLAAHQPNSKPFVETPPR